MQASVLSTYISQQLSQFFPDGEEFDITKFRVITKAALDRAAYCFTRVKDKNFVYGDESFDLNYLNGDHYSMFLYFLSNEAYRQGYDSLYQKASLLNKYLHGIDLFGHVDMPDIFLLVHPTGTIIGRAEFKNYLVIYQSVTIGGTLTEEEGRFVYPRIGEGVILYSNTSLVGDCHIADNVVIGANSSLINISLKSNQLVTGIYPNNKLRKINYFAKNDFFRQ